MPWALEITGPARKDLEGLAARDPRAVGLALDRVVDNPGAVDLAKLSGQDTEWRLRVGRLRVILELLNERGRIRVLRGLPRGRAYR